MRILRLNAGLLLAFLATSAHAYIGPGAGVGAIAVVLGVIASIFLAFVAILWYPIKRLIKGWRTTEVKPEDTSEQKVEGTKEPKTEETSV